MLAVQLLVNATINVYGHGHEKTEYCRTEENCQISARTLCPKKSDKIPVTTSSSDNYDKLEISPITNVVDPSSITESLANLHIFTALIDEFDYST